MTDKEFLFIFGSILTKVTGCDNLEGELSLDMDT